MEFFLTKSLVFIGFSHFGTEFLCSGSALGRTEPNFQVQVRAKAEPNIRFRFRFSAKSAKLGPNRTVASLLESEDPTFSTKGVCVDMEFGHRHPQYTLSIDYSAA